MATIFTRILDGELPGRFLWRDDTVAAWLDIRPLAPGHSLVLPIAEIDHWSDMPVELATHVMEVAHAVANAQRRVFSPPRIGLMIVGFEVPHVHAHVFPATSMQTFDFKQANTNPDAVELDRQMHALRAALRAAGHARAVPS